jgi:circadian clock protein KaiC
MELKIASIRGEFAALETETQTLIAQAHTSEALLLQDRRAMAYSRKSEVQ